MLQLKYSFYHTTWRRGKNWSSKNKNSSWKEDIMNKISKYEEFAIDISRPFSTFLFSTVFFSLISWIVVWMTDSFHFLCQFRKNKRYSAALSGIIEEPWLKTLIYWGPIDIEYSFSSVNFARRRKKSLFSKIKLKTITRPGFEGVNYYNRIVRLLLTNTRYRGSVFWKISFKVEKVEWIGFPDFRCENL